MQSIAIGLSTVLLLQNAAAMPTANSWPGWAGVRHLFVFGDSYSSTVFDPKGTQPNPSNPMGNPPYPGYGTAVGPNWVGFVTTTYNKSLIYTYNMAVGGATVDSDLVKPYTSTVLSLKQQVSQQFLPNYGNASSSSSSSVWKPTDTLAAFWFGINDVSTSWWQDNSSTLNELILAEYRRNVDVVYSAGMRNFAFVLVPAVERLPNLQAQQTGDAASQAKTNATIGADVAAFNQGVKALAISLGVSRPDTAVFIYDAFTVFNNVLDRPGMYPQTAGLKNLTTSCPAYENNARMDSNSPSCSGPISQYFWKDKIHPTWPFHNASAEQFVLALSG